MPFFSTLVNTNHSRHHFAVALSVSSRDGTLNNKFLPKDFFRIPPDQLPPQTDTMSYQKGDKDFAEQPKAHRIRITLSSRKLQSLERVSTELIERARSKGLKVKGPVRLPVRLLLGGCCARKA